MELHRIAAPVVPLPPPETFISEDDAARLLGVSGKTLQRHRKARTGPSWHRFSTRRIAYRVGDVLDWAEGRRVAGTNA